MRNKEKAKEKEMEQNPKENEIVIKARKIKRAKSKKNTQKTINNNN